MAIIKMETAGGEGKGGNGFLWFIGIALTLGAAYYFYNENQKKKNSGGDNSTALLS